MHLGSAQISHSMHAMENSHEISLLLIQQGKESGNNGQSRESTGPCHTMLSLHESMQTQKNAARSSNI